jgi:carotenoid cleavage dioxygenase-like enzyme
MGFRSLLDEDFGTSLTPSGVIPDTVVGSLYSVGPARFEIDHQSVDHWLDGFAAISSVEFARHKMTYRRRFIASNWYRKALMDNTPPPGRFVSRQPRLGHLPANDNANMNIIPWKGRLELLGNTPQSIVVDAATLATVRTQRRTGVIVGVGRPCACPPHPVIDRNTGERYDLMLSSRDPAGYVVVVTDVTGKTRRLCRIPSVRLGYMHTFSVTASCVVLVESPFTAWPRSLASLHRPYLRNFVWDAARGTRILIADRRTGVLKAVMTTRPLFTLHHINAWDEGDRIVIDLAAYPDPSILAKLTFDHGQAPSADLPCPQATRLTIDQARKSVSCVPLKCPSGEFCVPDARYAMRPYTVLFMAGSTRPGELIDRLCRWDSGTGITACWSSDDCLPGAPVFVPSSSDSPEGTGWLLSFVLDVQAKKSFLLILDATTMTEEGRLWLPHALPFGLHTVFVPGEATA